MSGIRAWWQGLPLWARDGVLASVVTAVGQIELVLLADEVSGPLVLQHLAFAVMTASLVIRRARAVAAAVVVAVGLAFQTVLGDAPVVAGFVALLMITYSVAQYADRRRDALLGLLAIVAAIELYPFVVEDVSIGDEIGNVAIPIIVWVFARLARERLDRAVRAEREAVAARTRVREGELAREAALAAERRRIAREMHDVVGHGVTLMLLHTDAAQASLGGREPATAQALDVVLAAGRTALADLQRLLRVLRDSGGDPPGGEPCSLAAVAGLAEGAASGGRDVAVTVDGRVRPLPAAVEATAYRVVQESITNALKHAPGGRIRVRVHYGEQAVEVEVTDDGGGSSGGARGRGFGLAGIRERVALFDGRVSAGPRDDGPGWRTSAVLPVPAPEPAPA
ncbi:signal transduction histidine kinase [Blastococcus colisei]|uniref:histidine kinase n=1 Tax=Blastococcus colisei TaxID=1564162 RepID=A0A543PJW1_9ACTN|nr:histidine kinase [Blastococcus colisei]TQN44352.1 signal transduction histidine kinase [Blastococcus colisei]